MIFCPCPLVSFFGSSTEKVIHSVNFADGQNVTSLVAGRVVEYWGSLFGLNFGVWRCPNKVASYNWIGRMEKDGNQTFPKGNVEFPFALNCNLNGMQYCNIALGQSCKFS